MAVDFTITSLEISSSEADASNPAGLLIMVAQEGVHARRSFSCIPSSEWPESDSYLKIH